MCYCSLRYSIFGAKYSRTPLIRTLVIRIANYPDRLGPSGKRILSGILLHFFVASILHPSCQILIWNCVLMLYL